MDTVINDFVHVLREHRLRVSPAESLDALHALHHVGLSERGVVRDALKATLVKNMDDAETFDRLFDLYFDLQPRAAETPGQLKMPDHDHDHGTPPARMEFGEDAQGEAPEEEDHTHDDNESVDMRRFFDEDEMRPSNDIHGDTDRMRISLFSQQLILNQKPGALQEAMKRLTYQLKLRRARGVFNPGELLPNTDGQELPLDISAVELEKFVDHLHEMEVDEQLIRQLEAQSDDILRGLPELIEQMLERQKRLEKTQPDDSDLRRRSLRKLLNFSAGEQREMEAAIRRIARQIHGAKTRRLRKDRTGRISVAHTLRHNLRYGGIPFQPVLRRKREQKPRLVLLCDVSISTRNLARFWLHLTYRMQNLFSKVRTFVFVADTVEVTRLFEENNMNQAVEHIFSGRILDADVNSDFGKAAEQFRNEHLPTLNHRTTLVILGDGRNNGKPPNVEALEEMSQHVRQLIWITPEPKWSWSLGSCDMPLYEPLCNRIEVVRTVDQLAGVAEELVRSRV